MTISLAKFLVDFSEIAPPPLAGPEPATATAPEPVDPIALRIDAARQEAIDEIRAESVRALDALRAEHADSLEQERQRWIAQEGERIGDAFAQEFARLEEHLAATLADLLQPLVTEAVRRKAARDLRDTVAGVLANAGAVSVTVTGPDDLTAAIQASYAGPAHLLTQNGTTGDVTIRAGDTHIRTQLEAWAERLRLNLETQP